MSNLTIGALAAFNFGAHEAEQLGSAAIDVEHLFLGLCKVESVQKGKSAQQNGLSDAELRELREEVASFAAAVQHGGLDVVSARRRMRQLWHEAHPLKERFSGHRTQRCRQIFSDAEAEGSGIINLAVFLRVVLKATSPLIDEVLRGIPATREKIVAALPPTRTVNVLATGQNRSGLLQFGRDLSQHAREGRLSPVIGRDEEIKKVARILLQTKKANPILVGDAGVGKTAIVEGLALKLLDKAAPAALRDIRLVDISLGLLLAGTKYRGEFEERVQWLLHECEADHSLVLFIDEIHMLLGAGAASGAMDAASLLKPALARSAVRCIGATTPEDYRKHIEPDPSLERRFQLVWVEEPSPSAAISILQGLAPQLEQHHAVTIASEALEKAVELSVRYLPDLRLPDKAIDIVDQACARVMLSTFSPRDPDVENQRTVGLEEIAEVISERCRIPVQRLTADEGQRLLRMESELEKRVMGQPEAVGLVSQTIRSAKAGLRDSGRPIGIFLFLGPTGVGKTELAKATAEFLFGDERSLIRIDMSEYAEKHSVAKLIGSPPGYVGHDEGGYLTNLIRRNPYSVVLFDEIEKAHPDVFDLFLQIFDEGRLTDSRGRSANFKESLIILTSNTGSASGRKPMKRAIGFVGAGAAQGSGGREQVSVLENDSPAPSEPEDWRAYDAGFRTAAERLLPPEIRNRIHNQIVFRPLGYKTIWAIIDKIIDRVNRELSSRRIRLELGAGAKDVLMAQGYSEEYGARAMERTVHSLIEEPLGRLIIQKEVRENQRVLVLGAAEKLQFQVT